MGIFKLNGIDYMGGSGGGNTNYEELTQLEYDALTEEEKNNGTIYFITDANSNQDSKFQPIIYSEEEREIGVWTDGKPLYQRTIIYSTPFTITNGSWYTSSETYEGLNLINGEVLNNAYGYYQGVIIVFENNHLIIGNQTKDQPITNVKYVTLQYTKTTDTPGSGQWTPQGVPAVHYSTEEQIVGTWVDGSTVYEKVWNFSSPPVLSTQWLNVGIDCSTFDKILHVHTIHSDGTGYGDVCADPANNDHMLRLKAYSSSTCATLILRYTKKSS